MNVKPYTAVSGPSPSRVNWFEKTYRLDLPADYVRFLETGNGGIPIANIFTVNGRERVLESFLCLLENPLTDPVNGWRDITVVLSQLDERLIDDETLIGMNVIPIALLFGGDFVCLDFRQYPTSPVVVIWCHEQSDGFDPHFENIAQSFSAFLTMLNE